MALNQKPLAQIFENTSVHSVRDIVNSSKNHPNIIKIVNVANRFDVSDSERFSFKTVNASKIKDLLKNLDIKKTSGIDKYLLNLSSVPLIF